MKEKLIDNKLFFSLKPDYLKRVQVDDDETYEERIEREEQEFCKACDAGIAMAKFLRWWFKIADDQAINVEFTAMRKKMLELALNELKVKVPTLATYLGVSRMQIYRWLE